MVARAGGMHTHPQGPAADAYVMVEGKANQWGPECPWCTSDCWIMPWVWHDGGTHGTEGASCRGVVWHRSAAEDRLHPGPPAVVGPLSPGKIPLCPPVVEAHSVACRACWVCAGLSVHMVVAFSGDVSAGILMQTQRPGLAAGVVPRLWRGHRRGTGERLRWLVSVRCL